MRIVDELLAKIGYVKASPQKYPAWALQNADAVAPNYPTWANADDKLNFYRKVSWVNIAVNSVSTIGSGAKWAVKTTNGEKMTDVPNHDFERLLKKPNPTMSRADLVFATLAYMSVTNNAYWWLNIVNGKPAEIWVIPSKQISPLPDGNLYIRGYEYDPGDGQFITLEPYEVVAFTGFNPDSMFEGFSSLEPLRDIAIGDVGMQKWSAKTYTTSNGRLPGILAFADSIPDDDWSLIQQDVNKAAAMRNYMMLRNVKAGGVQWLQASASPKDMMILEQRLNNRDEIFSSIAPGLASLLSVNASLDNARTGKATLIDLKVYPMLQKIGDVVTNRVMPMYGENYVFEPEDIRITDKVLTIQETAEYSKTHTVNEVREKYWQSDPIKADDVGGLLVAVAQSYQAKEEAEPEESPIMPTAQEPEAEPPDMPEDEQNPAADDMETRAELEPVKAEIYPAMLELEKWERKVIKANGKRVEFIAYNIPADVAEAVRGGMTFDDARKMLKGQPDKPKEAPAEVDKILQALAMSVKALELSAAPAVSAKAEPMNITIHNHPGEQPEVKADFAPIINIPAPIVNVQAAQAPVVNNTVNVPEQAAPVVNVNMPEPEKKSARVTRGPDGKISGMAEI